ncbi:MAG TPA: peptidoglycan-binding domain-containing protein [Actinomycetes bacterium]|nr:peptidoglycan-binding domain-containing protein [Actinomycetes bacterium]
MTPGQLVTGRGRGRRGRRPRALIVIAIVAVLMVGAAGTVFALSRDDDAETAAPAVQTALAEVKKQDLVKRETLDGTLTYDDTRQLVGQAQGTVTAIAPEGQTVARGDVLYKVDSRPVVLLYGARPAWRALSSGVDAGDDVRQLEISLRKLGYDPDGDMTVDREFDSATGNAVKRWQDDLGVEQTGTVAPGDVVFLPGAVRVGEHSVEIGDQVHSGAEVLQVSATTRVVTFEIGADEQDLVADGDAVQVALPGGTTLKGTISEVGKVATTSASDSSETGSDSTETSTGDAVVDVTVRLGSRKISGNLDRSPVDVKVTKETSKGVLTVPVTALVALAGGGYAVEVDANGSRSYVAVDPGMFADGMVAVKGGGLHEGTKVVVPA